MDIILAARKGRINRLRARLTPGNANFRDINGRTPLSWAAGRGQKEALTLLLANDQVDPDSRDDNGRTPLSWAAVNECPGALELLLANDRVDPDSRDNDGRTPLSWAAENGHNEALVLLLADDRVNPNSRDNNGLIPLTWIIKEMQSRGSWLDKHQKAEYPLMEAFNLLLLNDRTDINFRDNEGRTMLSRAAANGHDELLKVLLADDRVDPNSKDSNDRTPLSWAAGMGHKTAIRILLADDRIHPGLKDQGGRSPLSWAAANGKSVVVEELLKTLDVHSRDNDGSTPLCLAVKSNHRSVVKLLIQKDRLTLHFALQSKDHSLVSSLIAASVDPKDITAQHWHETFQQHTSDIVRLSEGQGERSVNCVKLDDIEEDILRPLVYIRQRHLFLCPDYSPWQNVLFPERKRILEHNSLITSFRKTNERALFSIAFWFPAGRGPPDPYQFTLPDWGKCAITWIMIQPENQRTGQWISVNHYSMLLDGWIPDDGIDMFKRIIAFLKARWLKLLTLIEDHLDERRSNQLNEKGTSPRLVHHLAGDAQKLTELRSILRAQVNSAKLLMPFMSSYFDEYSLKTLAESIDDLSNEVNSRLRQLDQTVRDLLQFEFAWVSINEAHRSTSFAISMRRLSWITFVFLPLTFTSSLFGMNVNILENNPDWRWYPLISVALFAISLAVWFIFKCYDIEKWLKKLDWTYTHKLPLAANARQ